MSRPDSGDVRSFLAVLLPEEVRQRLWREAQPLREAVGRVAWVRVENLHVTLRFLGSVDEATLRRAADALAAACAQTSPFTVTLGGLGGFPGLRAPRVAWAGVAVGGEMLVALHARVERALAERGVPPEGRPFHPHVTLGRTRDPRGAPELGRALAAVVGAGPYGEVRVDAVHLMRSELDPTGARYGTLVRAPLGG